jgi:hypothetical protein
MGVDKEAYLKAIKDRGDYTMIPNEVIATSALSVMEKTLWMFIASQSPSWKSSRNKIAKRLSMSRDGVAKSLKTLKKLNMLAVYETNDHSTPWSFKVIPTPEWDPEVLVGLKSKRDDSHIINFHMLYEQSKKIKDNKKHFYVIEFDDGVKIGVTNSIDSLKGRYSRPWNKKPISISIEKTISPARTEHILKRLFWSETKDQNSTEFFKGITAEYVRDELSKIDEYFGGANGGN